MTKLHEKLNKVRKNCQENENKLEGKGMNKKLKSNLLNSGLF